jgi:hypothetical protein
MTGGLAGGCLPLGLELLLPGVKGPEKSSVHIFFRVVFAVHEEVKLSVGPRREEIRQPVPSLVILELHVEAHIEAVFVLRVEKLDLRSAEKFEHKEI